MKLKTIAKLAMLIVVMSSCALNKKAYKNVNEIAVISYNSTEKVKNQSSLQARVLSEIVLSDTVLAPPAEKVKNSLFKNLNKDLLDKIISEEEIIETSAFKKYAVENHNSLDGLNKVMLLGVGYEAATGYPVILPMQKEVIKESFKNLPPEVDAVMVMSSLLEFQESSTVSIGGFSTAGLTKQKVRSTLTVYIINRSGKRVFMKSFIGLSAGKLGHDDEDNEFSLDELVDQAIQDCFYQFNRYWEKKLKLK